MRPDLWTREITNGILTWYYVCMALMLIASAVMAYRREERMSFAEWASLCMAGVFASGDFMRAWIWAVMWLNNHGFEPIFRDADWMAWISVCGTLFFGTIFFILVRARWRGQHWLSVIWPATFSLVVSLSIPFIAHYAVSTIPPP